MRSSILARRFTAGLLVLIAALALTGCTPAPGPVPLPSFDPERAYGHQIQGLSGLSDISSAVVIVTATGQVIPGPVPQLPKPSQDPNDQDYYVMTVTTVLAGALGDAAMGDTSQIRVVSPGVDLNTGQQVLVSGGPYLLFITPATLASGKIPDGYVVSGGPAGLFVRTDPATPDTYTSAFRTMNDTLPESIDAANAATEIPPITHTEAELIAMTK